MAASPKVSRGIAACRRSVLAHPQERPLLAHPPRSSLPGRRRPRHRAVAREQRPRGAGEADSSGWCSTTSSSPGRRRAAPAVDGRPRRRASAATCSPGRSVVSGAVRAGPARSRGPPWPKRRTSPKNGAMEDERVAAFGRLVRDWIENVSEPQILARERGTDDRPRGGRRGQVANRRDARNPLRPEAARPRRRRRANLASGVRRQRPPRPSAGDRARCFSWRSSSPSAAARGSRATSRAPPASSRSPSPRPAASRPSRTCPCAATSWAPSPAAWRK